MFISEKPACIISSPVTITPHDSQNQLIREDNQAAGKTWVWIYDGAGNITAKKEYAYTTATVLTQGYTTVPYGYGNAAWGDLLTSYNGQTITYDAIGNPLSDGTWNYTWEQGRQLSKMSSGFTIWSFTYDANGMRTARAYLSTIYGYTYNGSQLSRMTCGSNTMWFTYGADGSPLTIKYNGATYYYVTNLQGDVVAILNSAGTAVVNYTYDAWGKPLTTTGSMANTLGLHNPLRYRGYVYDQETGLYYLQSRYYNPTWGRFLNADDIEYLGADGTLSSYNLYSYCGNNPVNKSDPTGCSPKWWQSILIGAAVIAVTAVVVAAIATTGGGAAAVLATTGKVALGAAKIAATAGVVSGTVRAGRALASGENSGSEVAKKFVTGFADGFFAGSLYSSGSSGLSLSGSGISGMINNGYGWSCGKWIGGYQTPSTPGVSLATYKGGSNGGRSFGVDLDIYNGLHFHTNKFGIGKKSKWIKAHHWGLSSILVGLGVGFSDEWSEW